LVGHDGGQFTLRLTRTKGADLELFLVVVSHVFYIDVLVDTKVSLESFNVLAHLVCGIYRNSVTLIFYSVKHSYVIVTRLGLCLDVWVLAIRLIFKRLKRALKYSFAKTGSYWLLLFVHIELHLSELRGRRHVVGEANKDWLLKI